MICRILIVDDHPVFRQGLAWLIGANTGFSVCGEAPDCKTAIQLFETEKPDLAVVDLSLHESSGMQLIKMLRSRRKNLKILVASMHDEFFYAERCLRMGANGYINKEEAASDIIHAIHEVMSGHIYLNEKACRLIANRHWQNKANLEEMPEAALSDREIEVFSLIGSGLSTKKIADRLHLSPKTIDSHREHIKQKLGVNGNIELVQRAVTWVIRDAVV